MFVSLKLWGWHGNWLVCNCLGGTSELN